MKKTLFIIASFLLTGVSLHAGIEGTYDLKGRDPYEKVSYVGTATITKDKNNVYQAEWLIEGKRSLGTGLINGNTVSFIFINDDQTEKGVQIYQIKGDVLQGPFVFFQKNLVGNEEMTKK